MIRRVAFTAAILSISVLTDFDSPAHRSASSDDSIRVSVERLLPSEETRSVLLLLSPEKLEASGQARKLVVLPLVIGIEEARSIKVAVDKIALPRPLSHDLMRTIIEEYGGTLVDCTITKMERETFFAELRLKRGREEIKIDCRPSDAIGLALRANVPIYVKRSVMSQHGVELSAPGGDRAFTT